MSISSQIERLQGVKARLKSAISGRGVTVPASAKLDDLPGYIQQISGDSLEQVLPRFRGVVRQAVDHIETLGAEYINHIVVTDLHYDVNSRNSAAIANYLMSTGLFDKLMLLGDMTDSNTQAQYTHLIDDGWTNNNGNIIFCFGNHDGINAGSSGRMSISDYYSAFLSEASYADGAENTLYYYYDDLTNKIRYVALNTESWNGTQAAFLTDAVNLDNTWTIFILSHRNININMHVSMAEYVNLPAATSEEIINIVASSDATIGGMICGHQHVDSVDTTNDWYQIALSCDRLSNQSSPRPPMTAGQLSEQAVTIWSINTTTGDMEFWRIGAYDQYNDVTVNYKTKVTGFVEYTPSLGNLGIELVDFTNSSAWSTSFAEYTVISATTAEMTRKNSGGYCQYTISGLESGATYYAEITKGDHALLTITAGSTAIVSRYAGDWSGFFTMGEGGTTLVIRYYAENGATNKTITASLKKLSESTANITPLTVTANGIYTAPDGTDGYNPVTVNVGNAPSGTKQINITANGTITEDVSEYASAEITVAVPPSGWSANDIEGGAPTGAVVSTVADVRRFAYAGSNITSYENANWYCRYTACSESVFQKARSLVSVSLAKLYNAGGTSLFTGCIALTTVSMPECRTIGQYAFSGCTSLTAIALPKLTTMAGTYAFQNCSALAVADLGNVGGFGNYAFSGCTALRTLILRKTDSVVTLGGYNANYIGGIYNNPTASTVYVPSSLLSAYQTANNWSSAYNAGVTFAAIEGSIYETQYGDGTAVSA